MTQVLRLRKVNGQVLGIFVCDGDEFYLPPPLADDSTEFWKAVR